MTAQPNLFEHGTRRDLFNGTATSRAAAVAVRPRLSPQRARVLAALKLAGDKGMTNDELSAWTELPIQSICPRVNSLAKDGLIEDSGERRKTRAGHAAIVWRVK